MSEVNNRVMSELYEKIDVLNEELKQSEKSKAETEIFLEEVALKIDGFSAILAGLSFSKEIGVDTLISAICSVSFSLDELKKNIDKR